MPEPERLWPIANLKQLDAIAVTVIFRPDWEAVLPLMVPVIVVVVVVGKSSETASPSVRMIITFF
jgi:hypothetical protein